MTDSNSSNEELEFCKKVLRLQMSNSQFFSLTFSKTETECPRKQKLPQNHAEKNPHKTHQISIQKYTKNPEIQKNYKNCTKSKKGKNKVEKNNIT